MAEVLPPPPGLAPDLAVVLQGFYQALLDLRQPGAPSVLWVHPTASTLEATAPAADYPESVCLVDDINTVACSTKIAGVYTWRRTDGTAL